MKLQPSTESVGSILFYGIEGNAEKSAVIFYGNDREAAREAAAAYLVSLREHQEKLGNKIINVGIVLKPFVKGFHFNLENGMGDR